MDAGAPEPSRGRCATKKTTPNSRRVWTTREEKVFLQALKAAVCQGWKSDNGFRTGYLVKLEDAMKKEFPLTDIVGQPHITSKITAWKKHYGSIVTAHRVTGVGFNCTTSQLDVDDDQWKEVLQKEPTMRGQRYKEWPYYPDWVEIFGKDRATGEKAEDVTQMNNTLKNAKTAPPLNASDECNGENYVDVDPNCDGTSAQAYEQEEGSFAYTTKSAPPMKMSGKKRKSKSDSSEPSTAKILSEFCRSTSERLDTIAQRIGYEHDLGRARQRLFGELGNITGLTIRDRLNLAKAIGCKVENLEMWMSLPDDARAVYVLELLSEDGV